MLVRAYLYNLAPGKAEDELVAFDRRVTERFTSYLADHGRRYLGVHKVDGVQDYAYAELTLVDAADAHEAQAQREALAIPPDVVDIMAECDTYMKPETLDLWLEPVVFSPNASMPLDLAHSLVRIYLFRLAHGTNVDEFARWERRITARYSEAMRPIDWYYAGAFRASGMPPFDMAGVDVVGADSPEEALARDVSLQEPPDVTQIVSECRAFRDPAIPVQTFWLRPLSISALAAAELVIAPSDTPMR